MKKIFIVITLAVAFMGCTSTKTGPASTNATPEETALDTEKSTELNLTGTYSIKAIKGFMVTKADTSRVIMNDDKGQISARMGCNTVSGTYVISDHTVTFNEHFMATRMYCEGLMGLEEAFSKNLPNTSCSVTSLENEVVFIGSSGEEILRLVKK